MLWFAKVTQKNRYGKVARRKQLKVCSIYECGAFSRC